jgi:hypothetical protein
VPDERVRQHPGAGILRIPGITWPPAIPGKPTSSWSTPVRCGRRRRRPRWTSSCPSHTTSGAIRRCAWAYWDAWRRTAGNPSSNAYRKWTCSWDPTTTTNCRPPWDGPGERVPLRRSDTTPPRPTKASSPPCRLPPSAHVAIQRGCDKNCSYCIVPTTRGPEHSRRSGDILEEVRRLVDGGVVEINLLGQTVNAWRADISFAELLRELGKVAGLRTDPLHQPPSAPLHGIRAARHGRDPRGVSARARPAAERKLPRACGPCAASTAATSTCPSWTGSANTFPTWRSPPTSSRLSRRDGGGASETLSLMEAVRFDQAFMFAYSARPGTSRRRPPRNDHRGGEGRPARRDHRTPEAPHLPEARGTVGLVEDPPGRRVAHGIPTNGSGRPGISARWSWANRREPDPGRASDASGSSRGTARSCAENAREGVRADPLPQPRTLRGGSGPVRPGPGRAWRSNFAWSTTAAATAARASWRVGLRTGILPGPAGKPRTGSHAAGTCPEGRPDPLFLLHGQRRPDAPGTSRRPGGILENRPGYPACAGQARIMDEGGLLAPVSSAVPARSSRGRLREDLPGEGEIHGASVLVRTEAFWRAGGYDSRFSIEDLPLWLALTRGGDRILVSDVEACHYRQHGSNLHSRTDFMYGQILSIRGLHAATIPCHGRARRRWKAAWWSEVASVSRSRALRRIPELGSWDTSFLRRLPKLLLPRSRCRRETGPRSWSSPCPSWRPGYGVATVASAQERILREAGYRVRMVALRAPKVPTSRILRASPIPWGFSDICRSLGAGLVVVHGPPFLGFSPEPGFHPVHWEHGMVFPEVLSGPYATRAAGALAQRERQCREAELVVCPSRTLAQRLNLPLARVIPNGADQLPLVAVGQDPSPRILLAVLRTGTVEDQYKGLGDLIELPSRLGSGQPWKLRVVLTGSGGAEHRLRNAGWEVFRDVTGPELARQYAEASVYLAPSRCESFDLPLVEAQRAGAAGLAFAGRSPPRNLPAPLRRPWRKPRRSWEMGSRRPGSRPGIVASALAEPFTWENHGQGELLALVRERLATPLSPTPALKARAVLWRLWWAAGAGRLRPGQKIPAMTNSRFRSPWHSPPATGNVGSAPRWSRSFPSSVQTTNWSWPTLRPRTGPWKSWRASPTRACASSATFPRGDIPGSFERALAECRGDVLFLSDQDDVWLPGKVELCLRALEAFRREPGRPRRADRGRCRPDPGRVLPGDRRFRPGFFRNLWRPGYLGCALAFRRDLLDLALPFPKNLPMHDWWLGLLAERLAGVETVRTPLILHRRHGGNANFDPGESPYGSGSKVGFPATHGESAFSPGPCADDRCGETRTRGRCIFGSHGSQGATDRLPHRPRSAGESLLHRRRATRSPFPSSASTTSTTSPAAPFAADTPTATCSRSSSRCPAASTWCWTTGSSGRSSPSTAPGTAC